MAQADGDGKLQTVGVMVHGGGLVSFKALPQFQALEEGLQRDLLTSAGSLGAGEVFDYYVERANGITIEMSEPFELITPDVSYALDHLVSERLKKP